MVAYCLESVDLVDSDSEFPEFWNFFHYFKYDNGIQCVCVCVCIIHQLGVGTTEITK